MVRVRATRGTSRVSHSDRRYQPISVSKKLPRNTAFLIRDNIRESLWFVPVVCVLAAVGLSFATHWVDAQSGYDLIPRTFTGGPSAALSILASVATSMVSLAALVLTITMVVVQLAMGQFSPRIVQTILKDKPSQLAIGIFVGTFAYAMLAMRDVAITGGPNGQGTVPGLAVVFAFLLVLISIVVLVIYVNHIGRSLRVSALIELVGSDTRKLLDDSYPESVTGIVRADDSPGCIPAPKSGVVCHVDFEKLVEAARRADTRLTLVPAIGEFVAAGAPLVMVEGDGAPVADEVLAAIVLGLERTLAQDVAYGLRMLVDIAERSLADSPFLDPTTAVQALDRLHDCLRSLAGRRFPDGVHRDRAGTVRLVAPVMTWDAYVHLAYDEIRQAGAGSPQVARRLRASLLDLLEYAPADRQDVIRSQLHLLDLAVAAEAPEHELAYFSTPDRQGIGVAAGDTAHDPARP